MSHIGMPGFHSWFQLLTPASNTGPGGGGGSDGSSDWAPAIHVEDLDYYIPGFWPSPSHCGDWGSESVDDSSPSATQIIKK